MKDELFVEMQKNRELSLEDADRILRNVFIACGKEPVSLYETVERMQAEHPAIAREVFGKNEESHAL